MTAARTNVMTIHTPEGLSFSLPLAGPLTRCMALIIDCLCIYAISTAMAIALMMLAFVSPDLFGMLIMLGQYVVAVGYGMVLEWFWRGRTIGKAVMRLRVMDEGGLNLRASQIVIRNLLRFVDVLPVLYLVGGVSVAVSRHMQRLGDLAASTIVVRLPKQRAPDLRGVLADKYNSFRDWPHLEARLRQRVAPAQAAIAVEALLRRQSLDADARVQLFAAIAGRFRALVEFPGDLIDGLSDEQYVRNVVDTLYRTR